MIVTRIRGVAVTERAAVLACRAIARRGSRAPRRWSAPTPNPALLRASRTSTASHPKSRNRACASKHGIGSTGSACTAPIAAYGSTPTASRIGVAASRMGAKSAAGLGEVVQTDVAHRHCQPTGQRFGNPGQRAAAVGRSRCSRSPAGPTHHCCQVRSTAAASSTIEIQCTAVELGDRQQVDLDGRDDAQGRLAAA